MGVDLIKFISVYRFIRINRFTLLNGKKIISLLFFTLIARISRRGIVEVGVYKGGASLLMSLVYGRKYREMQILIDPLSGHPSASVSKFDSLSHPPGHFSDTSLSIITELYAAQGFQLPTLIPLPIEETTLFADSSFIQNVGLVHLDTDLYLPTRFALSCLGALAPIGAIIILDDYGAPKCPGIEKAVGEFNAKFGAKFYSINWTKEQLILIKKCN